MPAQASRRPTSDTPVAGQASAPAARSTANKAYLGPSGKNPLFRPDIAIEETDELYEVKTLNCETHGSRVHAELLSAAHKAHGKYMRELKRAPLVIAMTTDGQVSKEGFASLAALTNAAHQDMPVYGPRMMLISGYAVCEAAAGAYAAWHWEAGSAGGQTGGRPPMGE